jgi:hypothetical protein
VQAVTVSVPLASVSPPKIHWQASGAVFDQGFRDLDTPIPAADVASAAAAAATQKTVV